MPCAEPTEHGPAAGRGAGAGAPRQLLGATGAHQPVRRRVGGVGDLHPDRALEIGAEQQVGAGVGVDDRRPAGSARRRGPRRAEVVAGDVGPPGAELAVAPPRSARRRTTGSSAARTHERDAGDQPGDGAGHRHDDGEPQGRHQHRALDPPAQRDAEALAVGRRQSRRNLSPRGQASQQVGSGDRAPGSPCVLRDRDPPTGPGSAAPGVRPSRRRRRRPAHHRRRHARPRGAGAGADRDRARAARGLRRAGAPAVRAGRPPRPLDREHPRHHRRRLPRRDQGAADQPRSAGDRSSCAGATGSPSWSSSATSRPTSPRWRTPRQFAWRRGLRFYRRLRVHRTVTRPATPSKENVS